MPEYFFIKAPTERNSILDRICDNMRIYNNPRLTSEILNGYISYDFCGNDDLTSDLINNTETPSIYTLYLYEDEEYEDDEGVHQITDMLAVINFSLSTSSENEIIIPTLCSNQPLNSIGWGNKIINKRWGNKIINKLFDAIQQYVNETNKDMDVSLTPVPSAVRFYKSVGMRLLENYDMIKYFTPHEILTLSSTTIVPEVVENINSLFRSRKLEDAAKYILSPNITNKLQIVKEIYRQNKKNIVVFKLFFVHFPERYKGAFFNKHGSGITKKKKKKGKGRRYNTRKN